MMDGIATLQHGNAHFALRFRQDLAEVLNGVWFALGIAL